MEVGARELKRKKRANEKENTKCSEDSYLKLSLSSLGEFANEYRSIQSEIAVDLQSLEMEKREEERERFQEENFQMIKYYYAKASSYRYLKREHLESNRYFETEHLS